MSSNIVAVITALGSCASAAAITAVVALDAPRKTGDALFASLIIAIIGLWRAKEIAANDVDSQGATARELSTTQDPIQQRIREVIEAVQAETISAEEAERLIAALRGISAGPTPIYGTPDGP